MRIVLKKKPQNPVIIEGFPGFGLVGSIATQFLIDHMDCELIGEFKYDELPAMVSIHKKKLIRPMAVYYSKKENIILLQTILNPKGMEWEIADCILDMAKTLKAKEIISLEGLNSRLKIGGSGGVSKLYYYGDPKFEKWLKPVNESVVLGVSAAMLLNSNKVSCIFAETHSALPDSKAAAKIIELLDKYLGLKVDYKPLVKQAELFETKLKVLFKESQKTLTDSNKKNLSYLG